MAYGRLPGTLSLCKDAAVLTHQNTVRKCRRLCQGPKAYHMPCRLPLVIEKLFIPILLGKQAGTSKGALYQRQQAEMKQQKRDVGGFRTLFWMVLLLNSLFST